MAYPPTFFWVIAPNSCTKKGESVPTFPFFITCYGLYPDFNLKEPEEQKEQRDGEYDLECFLTKEFLRPAAQHTAHKPTDDDGDREPHIREITGHQITDKCAYARKTGSDE